MRLFILSLIIIALGLSSLSHAKDATQTQSNAYMGVSTTHFEEKFDLPLDLKTTWEIIHATQYPVKVETEGCRNGKCISREIKQGKYGAYQVRFRKLPKTNHYFTSHWIKFEPGFKPGHSYYKFVYNRAYLDGAKTPGISNQVCYFSGQSKPMTLDPTKTLTDIHVSCDYIKVQSKLRLDVSHVYTDGLWHRLEERVEANKSYEAWIDGKYVGKVDMTNDGDRTSYPMRDILIGPYFNGAPLSDGKFYLDDFKVCLENRCK